jgi:tRNA G10  N-methylase Trm11
MRYQMFSKFDEAKVDAAGLYTMVPETLALRMAKRAAGSKVLDICSGIGSMSIAFARCDKQVTAVEIDENKVAMARHNASLYGVDARIDTRQGDITSPDTLAGLPSDIDTVWLDPPWGLHVGEYRTRPVIYLEDLKLAGRDLRTLVSGFDCREVMLRLPPNFHAPTFKAIPGEKLRFVMQNGHLLWYFLRTTKQRFLDIPYRA